MTDVRTIQEIDDQVHLGIEELKAGRRGLALLRLWRALDRSETIESLERRTAQLRKLADFFERSAVPDLQIMALEDAAELNARLGEPGLEGEDFLALGHAHARILNHAAAERCFRNALQRLLDSARYGSAAAASTGLSWMLGGAGRLAEAIESLGESLQYLKRENSPDSEMRTRMLLNTEMRTRMLLIQYVDQIDADPELAVEAGASLQERFGDAIWGAPEGMWRDALGRSIDRYLGQHPEIEGDPWKTRLFGWLPAALEDSCDEEDQR